MLSLIAISIFPAALVIAALTDIYDFKIPNWISLTLVAGFIPAGLLLGAPISLMLESLALGGAVLVVSFVLFAVKFFGGGDAKLLAAVAPWVGLPNFGGFLMSTVFAGGLLAIFLIAFRRAPALPIYSHTPWLLRMHQNRHEIPYAVAISAGGLMSFKHAPLFQLAFGG